MRKLLNIDVTDHKVHSQYYGIEYSEMIKNGFCGLAGRSWQKDVTPVGGRGASLGEMINIGVQVPGGFGHGPGVKSSL
jgi:hypothetical protein